MLEIITEQNQNISKYAKNAIFCCFEQPYHKYELKREHSEGIITITAPKKFTLNRKKSTGLQFSSKYKCYIGFD